jgi:SAM-dependent methyltransferase
METLNTCPFCNHSSHTPYLTCKDHTVSNEYFIVNQCVKCGLLFTSPRPDNTEIGTYYQSKEYVSHTNKSKGMVGLLYPLVRRFAVDQKVRLVKKLIGKNDTVVDIGAGNGYFVKALQNAGFQSIGFEPSDDARKVALNEFKVDIKPLHEISQTKQESIQCITLWHVLEHIHDLNETLSLIYRLLKQQGVLIIAVPNPNSWDAKHYGSNWAAYDVPRHLYHFKPETLIQIIEQLGLKLILKKPMLFDAAYVSILSEKYKAKNPRWLQFLNGVFNGLKSNVHAYHHHGNYSSLIYVFKKTGH